MMVGASGVKFDQNVQGGFFGTSLYLLSLMIELNVSSNNNFLNSRPAFFPAPEFVFNLIFGKERASIVTQSQVANLLTER